MISLKLQHKHQFQCHPTRLSLQNQVSIHETDREDISDYSSQPQNPQFKTIQSRPNNSINHNTINNNNNKQFADDVNSENGTIGKSKLKKYNKYKNGNKNSPGEIYDTQLLDDIFTKSAAKLPNNIRGLIMQQQKLVQDKVYIGMTSQLNSNKATILQRVYQQNINPNNIQLYVKQGLLDMMNQIKTGINTDITDTDKYQIHKIIRSTRKDLLQNKRGRFNQNYSTASYTNTSFNGTSVNDNMTVNSQPVPYDNYSLDSLETKKADNFIRKIKQEQKKNKQKKIQVQQKRKSIQVRSLSQRKQFEDEIKQQRKDFLKRRFQTKRSMREKQIEVRQKMNKDYQQFLAKYKKKIPLFMKKEQQFELEKSMEEERLLNHMYEKRKQQLKPIKLHDLKEHQQRYQELKKQKQTIKLNQKKIKHEESQDKINYPKSKYFEVLLEEQERQKDRKIKQDPKLLRSQLMKKRDQYAQSVRQNHLPKCSPQKHQELEKEIQKLKWSEQLKKQKKSDRQHVIEGDKNLKDLHRQIAQLRQQGKIPEQLSRNNTIDYFTPQKPIYKNYLEDLRSKRTYSIDYDNSDKFDLEGLDNLAKNFEMKANRRYLYANSNSNIEGSLREKAKADDDYLESVKVKVALLNKLQ